MLPFPSIFFGPLLISTAAVSSKITYDAYYTPSHYQNLYLHLFFSDSLSSPFSQTLCLNCSLSSALFLILILCFIYSPISPSLLLPSCVLEKRGVLSSNGMRLALGDDLPSSCIDTMLSIATQVTISSILFYAMLCYAMLCYAMLCYAMLCYAMLCYAMLCYVSYATQFYSTLISSILFYSILSFLLSSVCALRIFIYYHVQFESS